jgi:hypothetical protein
MADPLTALMYAVQVMNFLKTLILKTLRERKDSVVKVSSASRLEPSDENGHQSPSQTCLEDTTLENEEIEQAFVAEEPVPEISLDTNQNNNLATGEASNSLTSSEKLNPDEDSSCGTPVRVDTYFGKTEADEVYGAIAGIQGYAEKSRTGQSSNSNLKKGPMTKCGQQPLVPEIGPFEKARGISNLSRIDSRTERIEAWR